MSGVCIGIIRLAEEGGQAAVGVPFTKKRIGGSGCGGHACKCRLLGRFLCLGKTAVMVDVVQCFIQSAV